jgi:hypothetical protein
MIPCLRITSWARWVLQVVLKTTIAVISLSSCTLLTYNAETAAASAILSATKLLEARCTDSFSLEVVSVSNEFIMNVNSNRPFFHVVLSALTENKSAGQLDIFVFDGFSLVGFKVRNNDVVGDSVRC